MELQCVALPHPYRFKAVKDKKWGCRMHVVLYSILCVSELEQTAASARPSRISKACIASQVWVYVLMFARFFDAAFGTNSLMRIAAVRKYM